MKTMILAAVLCAGAANAFAAPSPEMVVQMGHTRAVDALAPSPDGRRLFTASFDATVRLWDVATGEELRVFKGHSDGVLSIAVSADGSKIATGSWDKTARLWDAATGRELRVFRGHENIVKAVALTPDGRRLITGSSDGTVRIWDLATGALVRIFNDDGTGAISAIAVMPDGLSMLTGGVSSKIREWNLATGALLGEFREHEFGVTAIAIISDGARFVSSSDDRTARVWDRSTRKVLRVLKHRDRVTSVAVTPDGRRAITGDDGKTARLWDLADGKQLGAFEGHAGSVNAVAASRDGRHVFTGSYDRTARLWDLDARAELRVFKGHTTSLESVAATPDGKGLVTGGGDGTARLWNLTDGLEARVFRGHTDRIYSVAVSQDGRRVVTASVDGTARSWDLAAGSALRTFTGHSGWVLAAAASSDGRSAVTGGKDKITRLWDMEEGRQKRAFKGHTSDVWAAAFSPDGQNLASTGWDGTVRFWDLKNGAELRRINGGLSGDDKEFAHIRRGKMRALAFTPDGRRLVTGGDDGAVRQWDLEGSRELRSFTGFSGDVKSVAVSPEGDFVAAAGEDGAILWAAATGEQARAFRGHTGTVQSVAFIPGGRWLATAGADGTTRLWERATGKELCRLISMDSGWVVMTPDGSFDGSPEGLKSIRWTVGMQSYPLEAFSEGYYVPGLLARIMAGDKLASTQRPKLSEGFSLPPSVTIVSPKNGSTSESAAVEVTVAAKDEGGGVDEIRLYHNGKAVGTETRGMKATTKTRTFTVALADGANVLRAVALSRDRIEGNPAEITVTYAGAKIQSRLHLLAVGLNAYKNPALNLNYAKPDAEGLLAFFAAAPRNLFNEPRAASLYDAAATKAGILGSLRALEGTAPDDVVVIYLAGHGDSVGADWYFIPHELVYPEKEGEIAAKAISAAELQTAVGKIGARKVVLLLDSCKSGSAIKSFAVRGFEDRKALAQLARATGVHVVAAASKDQFAAEVKELGHGVFTYTLLQALGGKADGSPKDGVVTIRELLSYVESELPELSQKYQTQAQYPTVRSDGMDFPITTLKAR